MDILILYKTGMMTARAYQMCFKNKLYTTSALKNYLAIHGDFLSLENFGKKINNEIIELLDLIDNNDLYDLSQEIEIFRLYKKGLISYELYTFCNNNKFFTINDLVIYLESNLNFLSLNNCKSHFNIKLLEIAELGGLRTRTPQQLNMFEDDSYRSKFSDLDGYDMSVRAYNVCVQNQLTTFKDLHDYYSDNGSFLKLPNCGSKTNEELVNIVLKNVSNSVVKSINPSFDHTMPLNKKIENIELATNDQMFDIVRKLTKKERNAINDFIMFLVYSVGTRTKNSLFEYYNEGFKIKSLLKKPKLTDNLESLSIAKVGKKSITEIKWFYRQLFINIILMESNPEGIRSQYLEVLFDEVGLGKDSKEKVDLDGLNGLELIDFLIKEEILFGDSTDKALSSINIYNDYEYRTLEELGAIYGLTRERIRQIRERTLNELVIKLKYIRSIYMKELFYISHSNDILIELSESFVESINSKYNVNFSYNFIIYLYSLAIDDHALLPMVDENFLFNAKSKQIGSWENFYLIESEVSNTINLQNMIEDVKEKATSKIQEDYGLNLEVYLYDFLVDESYVLEDKVLDVCEELISKEVGIYLNIYNELEFKRNVKKSLADIAYELLKEAGQPTKVNDLFDTLLQKYPDFDRTEGSFRNSFHADSRFVAIGRQSLWGLKEWEYQRDNFLGGTMIEIVESLLWESDEPMQISDITKGVRKYRDTDEDRLMRNLKVNANNKFIFLRNQYIGLANKAYDQKYEELKIDVRTWDESYEHLMHFLDKNNRLPKSSDTDEASARLYRWFSIQKKRCIEGKLIESRYEKISNILNVYESKDYL